MRAPRSHSGASRCSRHRRPCRNGSRSRGGSGCESPCRTSVQKPEPRSGEIDQPRAQALGSEFHLLGEPCKGGTSGLSTASRARTSEGAMSPIQGSLPSETQGLRAWADLCLPSGAGDPGLRTLLSDRSLRCHWTKQCETRKEWLVRRVADPAAHGLRSMPAVAAGCYLLVKFARRTAAASCTYSAALLEARKLLAIIEKASISPSAVRM